MYTLNDIKKGGRGAPTSNFQVLLRGGVNATLFYYSKKNKNNKLRGGDENARK